MIFTRDNLSTKICNIRTPQSDGSEIVGTATMILKDPNLVYLISASHVTKELKPDTIAVISDEAGNTSRVLLSVLTGGAVFEDHPIADISKAKVNINDTNFPLLNGRLFPYNQIDISDNILSRDYELTTLGFPLGLGGTGPKFSPLSYRSFVSGPAITLNRFDIHTPCDFIIMENPSVGGYSGGPMFDLGYSVHGLMTSTKENTIMHGVVHGTIPDNTGGKLGAITPCKYLAGWL
jgi:hypothetical protein